MVRYVAGQLPGVASLLRANDDIDGEVDTLRGDGGRAEPERRLGVTARTLGCQIFCISPKLV